MYYVIVNKTMVFVTMDAVQAANKQSESGGTMHSISSLDELNKILNDCDRPYTKQSDDVLSWQSKVYRKIDGVSESMKNAVACSRSSPHLMKKKLESVIAEKWSIDVQEARRRLEQSARRLIERIKI